MADGWAALASGLRPFRAGVGVVLVLVGIALAIVYRDTEFGFVRGLWLGLACVVVGVVDVRNALRDRR